MQTRMCAGWLCAAFALGANPTLGYAQKQRGGERDDFQRFDQAPYVFAQNPGRFAALWAQAREQTVRLAIFGDSQESAPGGAGAVLVPRLGYEFWGRFGNVPEVQIGGCGTTNYLNGAAWLLETNSGGPDPVVSRVPLSFLPPGVGLPKSQCSTNGSMNLTGEETGQLYILEQHAEHLLPSCGIPQSHSYFDMSGPIAAEVFAATNASSAEVYYRARPLDAPGFNYFGPVTTHGTLNLDLEQPQFEVRHGLTPPLDLAGHAWISVEICGDQDDKLVDVLGARLVNLGHPQGVSITPLCQGGYNAGSFLGNHADCGPYLKALGFHVGMICYGANDGSNGSPPAEFKEHVQTLMAWVREQTGDPHFPFLLMSDPDRIGIYGAIRDGYDRYPGVMVAIAQEDPDAMAINTRRMMDDIGWRESTSIFWNYAIDGIHYSPAGARLMARAMVSGILDGRPPQWVKPATAAP